MQTTVAPRPFTGIGRHISHSQVNLFDRCQLAWYLKYVKGIDKPASIPMLLGSAYHKALAHNFLQKRITGVDLPVDEVVAVFDDTFNSAVRECNLPDIDFSTFRDPVSRLLRHYYEEYVIGKMEPLLVEYEMVCPIPGCDRIFAGIMDVQLSDGTIVDFKVSSRRFSPTDVDENTQATAYALLYGRQTDFEFHVALRANKKPAIQVVRTSRTKADVEAYVRHLQQTVAAMQDLEAGKTEPTSYTGYCNDKMCQFYHECQDWQYGIL